MLLCGTGSFEKQWQGNGVSFKPFVRHGGIAAQETAEAIGNGFAPERLAFPVARGTGVL